MKMIDLSGKTFGRLTVLSIAENRRGKIFWECECSCGKSGFAISGSNLRTGHTTSCGCYRDEKRRHPHHGGRKSTEYTIWCGIKARCENPKNPAYSRYGGRGIKVHPQWSKDFQSFINDMGARPSLAHSIDRVDNDKNYEPGNCRWATRSEQIRNSKRSASCKEFDHLTKPEMHEDILRLEKALGVSEAENSALRAKNLALIDEVRRLKAERDVWVHNSDQSAECWRNLRAENERMRKALEMSRKELEACGLYPDHPFLKHIDTALAGERGKA